MVIGIQIRIPNAHRRSLLKGSFEMICELWVFSMPIFIPMTMPGLIFSKTGCAASCPGTKKNLANPSLLAGISMIFRLSNYRNFWESGGNGTFVPRKGVCFSWTYYGLREQFSRNLERVRNRFCEIGCVEGLNSPLQYTSLAEPSEACAVSNFFER